jgi:hypothetical protein
MDVPEGSATLEQGISLELCYLIKNCGQFIAGLDLKPPNFKTKPISGGFSLPFIPSK